MKIYHNKLVRDKILKTLKKSGVGHKYHIAKDDTEFLEKLNEKLREEIQEFNEKPSIEEFADILQVLETIARFHSFDLNEIKEAKANKFYNKGGFNNRIVLEETN
ncbi:MAG TPA: nucleoside triphosphate pyrophosphohydrolase [Salinivirgaceae bacterium]|nr:nucleoside triphosphate pyrophosphohydrolase [Salinivirgaceae bacterium]